MSREDNGGQKKEDTGRPDSVEKRRRAVCHEKGGV